VRDDRFLGLSGGYIRTDMIQWAETHKDALVVSVVGKAQPIVLKGEDADLVRDFLESRIWDSLSTRVEPE
jgi:hypothetical protein